MTDKEKEAIQTFEYFLDDISKNGGCTIDIDFQHKKEYEAMWKILNLIQTQQEEIEKKDKTINELKHENHTLKEKLQMFIPRRRVRRVYKMIGEILRTDIDPIILEKELKAGKGK